jgi:hypothetical protein
MLYNGNECRKAKVTTYLKAIIPCVDYNSSKKTEKCGIFQMFG